MQWFKHDSNANTDEKLQEVLLDYGLEGYGLYWYCLELIVNKIDQDNVTFELKHDARIIARNVGSTPQKVQEMMKRFIDLGLFEHDDGRITCLKLRKRLDKSMTSNSYIRNMITSMKIENEDYSGFLYLILAENQMVKRLKIGRSKNPAARINDLKKRSDCIGLNLSLLHSIKSDDCVSLETEMHRKFKHLNIKDEWFEYHADIIDHIESLRPDYENLRPDLTQLRPDYDLKDKNRIDKNRIDKNRIDKNRIDENRIDENRIDKNNNVKLESVKVVFDCWRNLLGHTKAVLDNKRKALIASKLKDYSEADLCKAISGCSKSPFHMGDNDRGIRYDGLDLILRNAEYIEKFIAYDENPPIKQCATKAQSKMEKLKQNNMQAAQDFLNGGGKVEND